MPTTRGMPSFGFRVGSIPVRVELTFFLIILLLGFAQPGIFLPGWVAAAFVSILTHELGHAVTGLVFGQTPRIVLHGLGGLTYGAGGDLRPWQNFIVSLAGSATQIVVLGLPALVLVRSNALGFDARLHESMLYLAFVSLVWAVFNLVPVLPLDGGNMALVVLTRLSPRHGPRAAYVIGAAIAAAGAAWGFANRQLLVGLMGALFAVQNFSAIRQAGEEPVRRLLDRATQALERGDHAEATRVAEEVLRRTRSGAARGQAAEVLAWLSLAEGRVRDATRVLDEFRRTEAAPHLRGAIAVEEGRTEEGIPLVVEGLVASAQSPNLVLVRVLARRGAAMRVVDGLLAAEGGRGLPWAATMFVQLHRLGEYGQAAEAGKRLFDDGRTDRGTLAYRVAGSLARAGRDGEAILWLDRAVSEGFTDVREMDSDPNLDSLRGSEPFDRLRAKVAGPAREAGGQGA